MRNLTFKKLYERTHLSIVQFLALRSSQIHFIMFQNNTIERSFYNSFFF